VRARAYRLTCEIEWPGDAGDVGFDVCRASGGTRLVAAGIVPADRYVYLDRTRTVNPTRGRTRAPLDVSTGRVSIDLLVDRTSVELFVGDGRSVQSHRVFPLAGDDGIRLYARGGAACFRDLTIRELAVGEEAGG
jgi:levanbiose-producing levanase